jgi:hypothetical protein
MKRNTTVSIILLVAGLFLLGQVSAASTSTNSTDKTAPTISSVYPKSSAAGISRTNTLYVKFSENIKAGANWSKIYVKNLKTGKKVAVSKSISGNVLYLKTGTRNSYTWYQIYIPSTAVKDTANNSLTTPHIWKFKTGTAATTVIAKGSKTVTVHQGVLYYQYNWRTYSYSNYNVKLVLTNSTYLLGSLYGTNYYNATIKKGGTNKLKVTQSFISAAGKKNSYTVYYRFNGANAVKFYKTTFFQKYYLKAYLK